MQSFLNPEMVLYEGEDGVAVLLIKKSKVVNLNQFLNYSIMLKKLINMPT